MYSYQKSIEQVVDTSIFHRGIKVYLDGGVISYTPHLFDYWRTYTVFDTYTKHTFTCDIPLIHLTVLPENWEKSDTIIRSYCTCTCPYAQEGYGICNHIVAIFAALEKETHQKHLPSTHASLEQSVISVFEEVTYHKKSKEWQHDFELWLQNPRWHKRSSFLASIKQYFLAESVTNEVLHELQQACMVLVQKSIALWEQEKYIHKIMIESLSTHPEFWRDIWIPVLSSIHYTHLFPFYSSLYSRKHTDEIKSVYHPFIKYVVSSYSTQQRHELLTHCISQLRLTFEQKIDLFFDFHEYDAIASHIPQLDPLTLLTLAEKEHSLYETVEPYIGDQIMNWLEFASSDDYQNVFQVLLRWKEVGRGISFAMKEYLENIQKIYPKRRKLQNFINQLNIN